MTNQIDRYAEVIYSIPMSKLSNVVANYAEELTEGIQEDYYEIAEYLVEPYNFDSSINMNELETALDFDFSNGYYPDALTRLGASFNDYEYEFAKILSQEGY